MRAKSASACSSSTLSVCPASSTARNFSSAYPAADADEFSHLTSQPMRSLLGCRNRTARRTPKVKQGLVGKKSLAISLPYHLRLDFKNLSREHALKSDATSPCGHMIHQHDRVLRVVNVKCVSEPKLINDGGRPKYFDLTTSQVQASSVRSHRLVAVFPPLMVNRISLTRA